PYRSNRDLPAAVRAHLPAAAQTTYRKAWNNAWKEYADPGMRRGRASREATAHRVAWSAVKKSWRKQGDRWLKK
ncbi:MAG TPA: ChaB family protein, partial [Gammaproteobacteria bacterium]